MRKTGIILMMIALFGMLAILLNNYVFVLIFGAVFALGGYIYVQS